MKNGGIIGVPNLPTTSAASGVWGLREQLRARNSGIWPGLLEYLQISPSLDGSTVWSGGSSLIFSSTGEYTITPVIDTTVLVKMWGAGGACGYKYTETIASTNNQGPGGAGGYSTATITLRSGSTYVFQIGEGGTRTTTVKSGATYLAGGVNTTTGGAEGGGYSGIFKTSVSQANAFLIAGGGGGGSDSAFGAGGGAGGGSNGENVTELTGLNQGGEGGTQSAGGAPSVYNNATAGSALTGGLGQNNQASLGGGGGGYFGGGGGNVGGGGGGSGFVGSDADISSGTTTAGSGTTPGNNSDSDRGTAGTAGVGGATSGSDGKIVLSLV